VFTTKEKIIFVVLTFIFLPVQSGATYYYNQDIKPIFQVSCSGCHNAKSGANVPDWSLYSNAFAYSGAISTEVSHHTMPPDGSLSSTDTQKIIDWVNSGALQDSSSGSGTGTSTDTGTGTGVGTSTGTASGTGTTTGTGTGAGTTCTHYGEYFDSASNSCRCPPNYILLAGYVGGGSVCTPKNPNYVGSTTKSDFFQSAGDPSYNGFPSCGPNRIAITANNVPYDISSSYYPNSSVTSPAVPGSLNASSGLNYQFAQPVGSSPALPQYLYSTGSRCACTYQTFGGTANPLVPLSSTGKASTIVPSIPADYFSIIKSVTATTQHSSTPMAYSPVAIDLDPTGSTDGRQGSEILAGKSQCGCPNLNEVMVPTYPSSTATPQGAYCRSIFADPLTGVVSDPNVVLVAFNPAIHDISGSSQIQNRSSEPQIPSSSGAIIAKIALPNSVGTAQTQTYNRKIWTCASGYSIDTVSVPGHAICAEPNASGGTMNQHQCSDGSGGGLASAVSSSISGGGTSLALQFNNAVNKKLSCCMHERTKGAQNFKFDCVDNSALNTYHDFDDLWTRGDPGSDGGQLNAIVLGNASGKMITGFYTLEGKRCDQYSEFGGKIYSARVDPKATSTPPPPLGTWSVDAPSPPNGKALNSVETTTGLGIPTTASERLACPIVVRSAITAHCSTTNPPLPAVQTYFKNGSQNRCTVADKITVYLQVKQVTEIVGQKPMKTFDTFMSPNAAVQFDVGKLVGANNGGQCPDGTTRVGNQCVYQ